MKCPLASKAAKMENGGTKLFLILTLRPLAPPCFSPKMNKNWQKLILFLPEKGEKILTYLDSPIPNFYFGHLQGVAGGGGGGDKTGPKVPTLAQSCPVMNFSKTVETLLSTADKIIAKLDYNCGSKP